MIEEYYIKFTDESKPILEIASGELNNDTTLTLFGRNTESWGPIFEANLISLLNNSANYYPPGYAKQVVEGQLWFHTGDDTLKLCTSSDPLIWKTIANGSPAIIESVITTSNFKNVMGTYVSLAGNTEPMTGSLILRAVDKFSYDISLATKKYVTSIIKNFNTRGDSELAKISGDIVRTNIHVANNFTDPSSCASKGYIDERSKVRTVLLDSTVTCDPKFGKITDCSVVQMATGGELLITVTGTLVILKPYTSCTITLPLVFFGRYYCLISGDLHTSDSWKDITDNITYNIVDQQSLTITRETSDIDEIVNFTITGIHNPAAKSLIDSYVSLDITGTLKTYQPLSALFNSGGLPLTQVTYRWYSSPDDVQVGKEITYTPVKKGDYYVTATFVDGGGNTNTSVSEVATVDASVNRDGDIKISYSVKKGKPLLTAEIIDADTPITPISWEWSLTANTTGAVSTPLADSNSAVWEPKTFGKYSVTSTYTDGLGNKPTITSDEYEVKSVNFDQPGDVTITGINAIHYPLTAELTDINRTNTTDPIKYTWYKRPVTDKPVFTTGDTYTPETIGLYYVTVDYTDAFSSDQSATSADFQVYQVPVNIKGVVTIAGGDALNNVLEATLVDANRSSANSAIEWQWFLDNVNNPISGATQKTYTPTVAGMYYAQAKYEDSIHPAGTDKEIAVSDAHQIKPLYEGEQGIIKIDGKLEINSTLTASLADADEPVTIISWLWQIHDPVTKTNTDAPGGVSDTFTPTIKGEYIVTVTYNDSYHKAPKTTTATTDILTITDVDTDGVLTILGETLVADAGVMSAETNDKLSAAITDTDVIDTTKPIKFQWYKDSTETVPLLAGAIYTPKTPGKYIVRATYHDSIGGPHIVEQTVTVENPLIDSLYPFGIGEPFGGGYYAGEIYSGGTVYYLIAAPKESEQLGFDSSDLFLDFDADIKMYDYNDWYIPSVYEALVMYENLKPKTNSNFAGPYTSVRMPQINPYSIPARFDSYDIAPYGPVQSISNRFKFNNGLSDDQSFSIAGSYITSTSNNSVSFNDGLIASNSDVLNYRYVRKVKKPCVRITGIMQPGATLSAHLVGFDSYPYKLVEDDRSTNTHPYTWAYVDPKNPVNVTEKSYDELYTIPNEDAGTYRVIMKYYDVKAKRVRQLVSRDFEVVRINSLYRGGVYVGHYAYDNMSFRLIRATDKSALSIPWHDAKQIDKDVDQYGSIYHWDQPASTNDSYGYIDTYLQSKYPHCIGAKTVIDLNITENKVSYKDWYIPTIGEIGLARLAARDTIETNIGDTANNLLTAQTGNNVVYGSPLYILKEGYNAIYEKHGRLAQDELKQVYPLGAPISTYHTVLNIDNAGVGWYIDSHTVDWYDIPDTAWLNYKQPSPREIAPPTLRLPKGGEDNSKPLPDSYFKQVATAKAAYAKALDRYNVQVQADADRVQSSIAKANDAHADFVAKHSVSNIDWKRYDWSQRQTVIPFRREIIYDSFVTDYYDPIKPETSIGRVYGGGYLVTAKVVVAQLHNGSAPFTLMFRNFANDQASAISFCGDLSVTANGVIYDNWRLPTDSEMLGILTEFNPNITMLSIWKSGGAAAFNVPGIYWVATSTTTAEPRLYTYDYNYNVVRSELLSDTRYTSDSVLASVRAVYSV